MTAAVWWWEAHDGAGTLRVADTLSDPFATTAADAAETALAQLMIRAAPHYGRLAGWRVRAGADGRGEAYAAADDWLPGGAHSFAAANPGR